MGPGSRTPELRYHLCFLGLAGGHPFHGRCLRLECCIGDSRDRLPGYPLPDIPVFQASLAGHILCRVAT